LSNDHRKGIFWACVAALGTASFVVPWKVASGYGDTATNTLILLAAAALFNSAATVAQQRTIPRFRRFDFWVAMSLAVLTLLGNLASAHAIALVSPSLLTVVQRSEVIIVALLAWPVLAERVEKRYWIGAGIAGIGLVVLNDPFSDGDGANRGVLWAIASAICFSALAVVTRKFIHRIDMISSNALRLWLAVGLWFVFNGFPASLQQINGHQVLYASLAAFFGPFLGRLSLMTSARYVEARVTSLTSLTSPPLTLLLAWILLSDLPSTLEMQGSAIMLFGIAIPLLGWLKPWRVESSTNIQD